MENVQQLIDYLQTLDPKTKLIGSAEIESGRSQSYTVTEGVDIEFYEKFEYQTEDDGEIVLENVLVFQVSGEETSYQ